jgi:CRISPR-associated protein Cas1
VALLVVQGAGTALGFRSGMWVVERGAVELRQVRPREVSEIQAWGPVELRPSARAAALARGVPVVFLGMDGRYKGRLESARPAAGELPLAQARWLADPARALALAQAIVAGKIHNCRALLVQAQRSRKSERIAEVACVLRAGDERLLAAGSLDAVRGHEGDAAARYFSIFGELVTNAAFPWTARSRRPPRDPSNAMLSFGYTLLASRVEDAVRAVGLLPGLGALHEPGPARAALVFDLVEEFRAPLVDRLVLRLVNRGQVSPEDFEDPAWRKPTLAAGEAEPKASGAVHMGGMARKLFLREFGSTLRGDLVDEDDGSKVRADWLLERQARRVARLFLGREERYRPFRWGPR